MSTPKPLIGLPGRRKSGTQVDGFSGVLGALDIDLYLADYSRGVIAAGGIPLHIPMDVDADDVLPHLDGLLLSGGADIDPSRYNQVGNDPRQGQYEPDRDELEAAFLLGCIERKLPVVGICRGLQLLNVLQGGTLHQDVPAHSRYDVPVDQPMHDVHFQPESRLSRVYGDRLAVNTLHHQSIDVLGEGLQATARSSDGTIEGIELRGHDVLGVQWHPEMLGTSDPIFHWLVQQC